MTGGGGGVLSLLCGLELQDFLNLEKIGLGNWAKSPGRGPASSACDEDTGQGGPGRSRENRMLGPGCDSDAGPRLRKIMNSKAIRRALPPQWTTVPPRRAVTAARSGPAAPGPAAALSSESAAAGSYGAWMAWAGNAATMDAGQPRDPENLRAGGRGRGGAEIGIARRECEREREGTSER